MLVIVRPVGVVWNVIKPLTKKHHTLWQEMVKTRELIIAFVFLAGEQPQR